MWVRILPVIHKIIAYGRMWLARDKNGALYFHGVSKPKKYKGDGMWISNNYNPYPINPDSFPEVQWSDEEPTKVKLVIDK